MKLTRFHTLLSFIPLVAYSLQFYFVLLRNILHMDVANISFVLFSISPNAYKVFNTCISLVESGLVSDRNRNVSRGFVFIVNVGIQLRSSFRIKVVWVVGEIKECIGDWRSRVMAKLLNGCNKKLGGTRT